ncbi:MULTISPECIES: NAD-dependent epimerase/dehydratase family protein [unclassified Saccharothrix]|uniref:NAD-dependent epimerase/dehydratase family protein n=1 Tax=unclassified Saccharothrix TaxID=2593673 RepID=UPI00307E66B6
MRIVVVGASGLVGRHIVGLLREKGHQATTVARTPGPDIDHALDATKDTPPLEGHDGVVFAAGVDDRSIPRKPAYPTFHAGNVEPVARLLRAAREHGLTRAVVLGSYYTHFHRAHPEWQLAAKHPYIRSRVEQARAAREAAGPDLPVAVLELPFVFGRAGDRLPNWAEPLEKWAKSRSPLVAPPGGSAATTARRVAEVAVEALEDRSGADIPVGDENLTWREMFGRIADATGHPRRVRSLPAGVVKAALRITGAVHSLQGKEPGLDPAQLSDLLLRELFLGKGTPGAIEEALRETFTR